MTTQRGSSMNCVIPGGNVRVLAKAICMMAKIGDEIYMHPHQDSISFCTVTMAKSAYIEITFNSNFFSFYKLEDFADEDAQKCKISIRSALCVFKSIQTLNSPVESCHILLEEDVCDLKFIIKYKNGINKSHLCPILDSQTLQVSCDESNMNNRMTSEARTLLDALLNFQQNLAEITLDATSQRLLLRNYVDDNSILPNTIRTQLVLGIGEFDRYSINDETTITFCMKEFKAFLVFSEAINIPINIHFEATGKPMLFTLKNQTFKLNMLLSTLNPDTDSQANETVINTHKRTVRKKSSTSRRKWRDVSKRTNKPRTSIQTSINSTFNTRQLENEANKILYQVDNTSMNTIHVKTPASNSKNGIQKKNQNKAQENQSTTQNSPSVSSTVASKNISTHSKKLITSVFSNIVKRKSTDNEQSPDHNKEIMESDMEENTPLSPVLQPTKKAKLIFQRCFQDTFRSSTLPGHDAVLVKDSDDSD